MKMKMVNENENESTYKESCLGNKRGIEIFNICNMKELSHQCMGTI